jgi:hypothetical protein
MKKLFVLLFVLLLCLPVVEAQEPVYLPVIWGPDMPFQILEISDGTTTVNLLSSKSGFCLLDWNPALAAPKSDGVWRDSQLAGGRRLALRERANVTDTLSLAVRDWTPDDLIQDTQNLRRLLEKAYAYDTTKWQDEPVWIKRHPVNATNVEYSIIHDYRTPQDPNPHGGENFWTGLAQASFPEFLLTLEHDGYWTKDQPGTGTCVETSGQQAWPFQSGWIESVITTAYCMTMSPTTGTLYYGDDNDPCRIWDSANEGTAWNLNFTSATGGQDFTLLWSASNGYLFACQLQSAAPGINHDIHRSINNGVAWAVVFTANSAMYQNAATEAANGDYFIGESGAIPPGTGRLLRSQNQGLNWAAVWTPPDNAGVRSLITLSDGSMLLGTNNWGRIYKSVDNGATWNLVLSGFSGQSIFDLLEVNENLIIGTRETGLVKSTDQGDTWSGMASPSPGTRKYGLFLDSNGTIWIGVGDTGVGAIYFSGDNGVQWVRDAYPPDFTGASFNPPNTWTEGPVSGRLLGCASEDQIGPSNYQLIYKDPDDHVVGRSATCLDEVFVANKQNIANLTHVKVFDASAAPPNDYTDVYPAGAFPYNLFPAVPAVGDMVYFGIDTGMGSTTPSGPFDNVILDIEDPMGAATAYTIVWEYSAAWNPLNVHDETSSFAVIGVNGVHFMQPSNWTTALVDGVTAYWIRARITAGTFNTPPTQQNRDPYTVTWPRVDVDDDQVAGDIPALLQVKAHNRSDEDGYESTIDELDTLDNRVIIGLRSLDRGEDFAAFLNCSDEQNPGGVQADDGANTADTTDTTAPTGRIMVHTTTGLSTWTDECTFTLASTIASEFYGSYHAYLRAQQVDRDTEMDEVRVRLQVRTGSGGVTYTTLHKPFPNLNDWQLIDFGGIDIPASGLLSSSDLGDETELVIQVWSSVAALTVNLYDLVLIPTDEWAIDSIDTALEDDSGVSNGLLLDVDSVTYPKRDIRSLVRDVGDQSIHSIYQPNSVGPAILQANASQRLWFLTARAAVTGAHTGANGATTLTDANASFLTSAVQSGQVIFNVTDGSSGVVGATVTATTITDCGLAGGTDDDWDTNDEYLIIAPNWVSEPWNAHSVQVLANARYLSMRGDR